MLRLRVRAMGGSEDFAVAIRVRQKSGRRWLAEIDGLKDWVSSGGRAELEFQGRTKELAEASAYRYLTQHFQIVEGAEGRGR
ncbi:MAG: hypothetical protein HYV08_11975 [Deltaproteobacteria bacterium]|nr:hypothetical protein [Deltaproteobacteria bacterium]MBI3078316.1 hypothetical protein [Deltaproteobacteria bacterium]